MKIQLTKSEIHDLYEIIMITNRNIIENYWLSETTIVENWLNEANKIDITKGKTIANKIINTVLTKYKGL